MKTNEIKKAGALDELKTYTLKRTGEKTPIASVRFNFTVKGWELLISKTPMILAEEDARECVKKWLAESWKRPDVEFKMTVCAYCGADESPRWVESKQAPLVSHGICAHCAAETLAKYHESRGIEAEFAHVIREAEEIKDNA